VDELTRLYVEERETLPEIASRFGVVSVTIGNRLRGAGVRLRTRGHRGGGGVIAIAKRLGRSQASISATLKSRGIANMQAKPHRRKDPGLWDLKVGEHLDVATSPARRNMYTAYYERAKRIGIRIRIRTVDEGTLRITRIDEKAEQEASKTDKVQK
jgi:hypothetical protein